MPVRRISKALAWLWHVRDRYIAIGGKSKTDSMMIVGGRDVQVSWAPRTINARRLMRVDGFIFWWDGGTARDERGRAGRDDEIPVSKTAANIRHHCIHMHRVFIISEELKELDFQDSISTNANCNTALSHSRKKLPRAEPPVFEY
jgi:hypothetical protein